MGKRGLYDAGKMRGHDDRAGIHVMSAHTVHRTEHPHSHLVTVFSGGQTSGRSPVTVIEKDRQKRKSLSQRNLTHNYNSTVKREYRKKTRSVFGDKDSIPDAVFKKPELPDDTKKTDKRGHPHRNKTKKNQFVCRSVCVSWILLRFGRINVCPCFGFYDTVLPIVDPTYDLVSRARVRLLHSDVHPVLRFSFVLLHTVHRVQPKNGGPRGDFNDDGLLYEVERVGLALLESCLRRIFFLQTSRRSGGAETLCCRLAAREQKAEAGDS